MVHLTEGRMNTETLVWTSCHPDNGSPVYTRVQAQWVSWRDAQNQSTQPFLNSSSPTSKISAADSATLLTLMSDRYLELLATANSCLNCCSQSRLITVKQFETETLQLFPPPQFSPPKNLRGEDNVSTSKQNQHYQEISTSKFSLTQ